MRKRKSHVKNRIWTVMCVFCMIFTMLPMTAFAADTSVEVPQGDWKDYVANDFAGGLEQRKTLI